MWINKGENLYFNSDYKDKASDKRKAFCCIFHSQELISFMSLIIYCIFKNILENNWSLKLSSWNIGQFSAVLHKMVHKYYM